ncbi:unnamed protein product [Discula destructiva]
MATPDLDSVAVDVHQHNDPKNAKQFEAELLNKFQKFDDKETYRRVVKDALSVKTNNFAVRFDADEADIAIDLDAQEVGALLQVQAEMKVEKVTWINIWSPGRNEEVVRTIASKYKFSTRMQETILGWDLARATVKETLRNESIRQRPTRHVRRPGRNFQTPRSGHAFQNSFDPEKGISSSVDASGAAPGAARSHKFHQEDIDMYKLLQEQYNYTTIDHGPNFVCIGANWLHHRPDLGRRTGPDTLGDEYKASEGLVPPKHWAWYVLTNEGTVISFHETPNYEGPKERDVDVKEWENLELESMRKNTRDLLHQLSVHGMQSYKARVSASKGVRSDLSSTNTTQRGPLSTFRTAVLESSLIVDGSANLFYYLFEDYTAATSILTRSNDILAGLTQDILQITDRKNKEKDKSYIIKHLYARSKDLRQLKHLFESYENLIKRIMALGTDTPNEDKDLSALSASTDNILSRPARGVKLSQKAFDRFDRLSVRMRLLMLDTIDEYLEEKASLSNTYFNLMSQKDSQATSKLNRSASLLAKLSVFFLPISFMTSYFSIQVPELTDHYTGTTYWVSFAVVATMSFLSLFFFSRLLVVVSDVLDEKVSIIEKKVGRSVVKAKGYFSGRQVKGQGQGQVEGGEDRDENGKELEDEQ